MADQNTLLKTLFDSIEYTKLPENGANPADGFTLIICPTALTPPCTGELAHVEMICSIVYQLTATSA
ncbi:MAG: hypothetical protein ACLSAP_06835 [Oscillospiraceae bacterium]